METTISELQGNQYSLINQDQEVAELNAKHGTHYDGFIVSASEVWGYYGRVPLLHNTAFLEVLISSQSQSN
jgi:hypothetical protein